MDYFEIEGGRPLEGEVRISGSKNATLPIMAASLMATEKVILQGVPELEDVRVMAEGMRLLGASVEREGDRLVIDSRNVNQYTLPENISRQMRASNLIMGALLGRFKEAHVAMPGGCAIGNRPMDQHLKGFYLMGYQIEASKGMMSGFYKNACGKKLIMLDFPSVGATENLMMAACLTNGTTILSNAAREPEIVDLQNFLNQIGARIRGAGEGLITIEGVDKLRGGEHKIIPDRIEAGTFMAAAALTGGSIHLTNMIPKHLTAVSAKLCEMGVEVLLEHNACRVTGGAPLRAADIRTMPYPGLPTDMQPQLMALLSMAEGTSVVKESIFENRFMHIASLCSMGARIWNQGQTAVVYGGRKYHGADVKATDLRAGAALVLAGLAADGVTRVHHLEHIDRGYECFEEKLRSLGASISRKHKE